VWSLAMLGWSSTLAALASARIRFSSSATSSSHSGTSNWRKAITRLACAFLALWTTPMPPRGISLTNSKRSVRGAAAGGVGAVVFSMVSGIGGAPWHAPGRGRGNHILRASLELAELLLWTVTKVILAGCQSLKLHQLTSPTLDMEAGLGAP